MTDTGASPPWTAAMIEKYIEAAFKNDAVPQSVEGYVATGSGADESNDFQAVTSELAHAINLIGQRMGVKIVASVREEDDDDVKSATRWLRAWGSNGPTAGKWLRDNEAAREIQFSEEIKLSSVARQASEVETENRRRVRLADGWERKRLRLQADDDGAEAIDDMAVEREFRRLRDEVLPDDPTVMALLCRRDDALMKRRAPHNAEMITDILLDQLITPERDAKVEAARRKVLDWLRASKSSEGKPLSRRAFSKTKGKSPTELKRAGEKYFQAIADRLNDAPRMPVKAKDNSHVRRDGRGRKLQTREAELIALGGVRPIIKIYAKPDIVWDNEICAQYERRPEKTLRLIDGGKLPVGFLAGRFLCANRSLLKNRKVRNPRQFSIVEGSLVKRKPMLAFEDRPKPIPKDEWRAMFIDRAAWPAIAWARRLEAATSLGRSDFALAA